MIGDKIKSLRISEGLTQQELADKLSISKVSISNWELNKGNPNYDTLKKIAEIFNVSTDFLLDYNENGNTEYYNNINFIQFKSKTVKKVIEMLKDKNITEKDLEQAIKIIDVLRENKKK